MTDQLPTERVAPRKTGWPRLPLTIPSGRAVMGGQCSHSAPDECGDCSGQRADERELGRTAYAAAKTRVPLTREQLHALYLANREALRSAS